MTGWFVLRRELLALLRLPQTYAIAAAYLVLSGVFFVNILISTEIPDLAQYYSNIASTLLVLVPVVAMRSFAEERRSGALDLTLTWPLSRAGLVVGKFVANTAFVCLLASIVWVYFWLIADVASIQGSRAAGGYVGLMLMAAAFSALALMVSARASSPAAAAFLGFGLLLFLWILDYAPGWIGDSLRSLGPAEHFKAFPRGVIYWGDVAYFLIVVALGLGLATSALCRERPGPAFGSLLRRGATLGVVVVTWAGGSALASDLGGKLDLTSAKEHTLTEVTKRVLRQVKEPIRLTGFVEPVSPAAVELADLVRQYRAAGGDLHLTILDPDVQPGKARQAGVSLYGQVVVEMGDRREIIDDASQIALTSALHRLAGTSPPRACFTIGHGERSITDETRSGAATLAGELRQLYYDVKPAALSVPGAEGELARCTVVVVAGPRVPFLAGEIDLLANYAQQNGRLVIMADGVEADARQQLNGLLAPWGLTLGRGTVSDASALADDPSSIVTVDYPSKSPATEGLDDQETPVVVTGAVPVEATAGFDEDEDDGTHLTALVRSSPKSWVDPAPGSTTDGTRLRGPFVLAAVVDRSRVTGAVEQPAIARTRIGVMGSVEMAANRAIEMLGNREFVTAVVQWVARQDDLIAAGRVPGGFYKLVLTESQKNRLIRQGIVVPAAVVLVPLPFALLRLRRG